MPFKNNQEDGAVVADGLFEPLRVGAITVPNRIFMAPMTRLRAEEPGDVPTALMAEYYGQRASAGLIITEATDISPQARGYAGSPGIYTEEQIEGWRTVTHTVHQNGGLCAVQIWHTGRNSHTSLQPGNGAPVAPSAIHSHSRTSLKDTAGNVVRVETSMPRALETEEVSKIVQDFGSAVRNARRSGFDLVELHGAHGYLLHQFFSPASNHRTDKYGGSVENRARFLLDVVDAAIAAWNADRIAIRLFPSGPFQGILSSMGPQDQDSESHDDYLYLLGELSRRKLAYLHLSEPDWTGGVPMEARYRQAIRSTYPGVIVGAGSYSTEKAVNMLRAGYVNAVAFGRPYIANPDLVARLKNKSPLNEADKATFYGGNAKGYTDYPLLD